MAKRETRMPASWQEVEKEVRLLQKLLERLPDEDRGCAAIRIMVDVAISGGCTTIESLGIFEAAKHEYLKYADYCANKSLDEEESDDA